MEESIFQWFPARCKELGIEPEDYQYYVNECEKYEFKTEEDLRIMCKELLDYSFKTDEDFQWRVKDCDETYLILLHEPDF